MAALAFTTPVSSTTRAASASSRTCPAAAATTWWPGRCRSCATWSTGAPRAATPIRETGQGSSPRSPTGSSAPYAVSPCRKPGSYAAGMAFSPPNEWVVMPRHGKAGCRRGAEDTRLARGPVRHRRVRGRRAGGAARRGPAVRRRRRAASRGLELERMAFCLRKRAEHEGGVYFASLSARTIVYKGMLSAPQLEPFFPDLSDPAVRLGAGPGALQVLHQHVPVLAAGPPVPVRGAQRRDQHDPGQPQLDAGPGGDAGQRPDPRLGGRAGASSGCSRSSTPTAATRPASTSAWNCCTWAAGRCRTRCS